MPTVQRNQDGWYETNAPRYVSMLLDIYRAGGMGGYALPSLLRTVVRRVEDLERRGA